MGNWGDEVVGERDGGVVGRFEIGCHSGKRMDPSFFGVGGRLPAQRCRKPRLSAHAHRDARTEREDLLLGIYHKF